MNIISPYKQPSTKVESFDQIKDFVLQMHDLLLQRAATAVALHHSQVNNKPLDFFVVRRGIFESKENPDLIICNAKIITKDPASRKEMVEGCLSWPFRGQKKLVRYGRVEVEYDYPAHDLNTPGTFSLKRRTEWVEGLTAQIFQHEIDHGRGVHIY